MEVLGKYNSIIQMLVFVNDFHEVDISGLLAVLIS